MKYFSDLPRVSYLPYFGCFHWHHFLCKTQLGSKICERLKNFNFCICRIQSLFRNVQNIKRLSPISLRVTWKVLNFMIFLKFASESYTVSHQDYFTSLWHCYKAVKWNSLTPENKKFFIYGMVSLFYYIVALLRIRSPYCLFSRCHIDSSWWWRSWRPTRQTKYTKHLLFNGKVRHTKRTYR